MNDTGDRVPDDVREDERPPEALTAVIDRIEPVQNGHAIAVLGFLDGKKLHVLKQHLPEGVDEGSVVSMNFEEHPEIEQERRNEISELQDELITKPGDDE